MPISLPPVIAGTSLLGNLYEEKSFSEKREIVSTYIEQVNGMPVFDTAGKYGAGLALEVLGRSLNELGIDKKEVIISNKLGWLRVPLKTEEPTFEPGVWRNLQHDAVQTISYTSILRCYEQGNELLQGYPSQMVSIHDPDEFLAAASDPKEEEHRFGQILEGYRALFELKKQGLASYVGVGSKDWRVIQRISAHVELDWVMFANSLSILQQPPELLEFIRGLYVRKIWIINSAVLHGGFLAGTDYFNYKKLDRSDPAVTGLFRWRQQFYTVCGQYDLNPVEVAIRFNSLIPEIGSIALGCSSPVTMAANMKALELDIPAGFWESMKAAGLLAASFKSYSMG